MTEGRTGGEGTLIEAPPKKETQKCSRNGSPWLKNQQLRIQNSLFFRAGAHGGRLFGQNHRFCSVFEFLIF